MERAYSLKSMLIAFLAFSSMAFDCNNIKQLVSVIGSVGFRLLSLGPLWGLGEEVHAAYWICSPSVMCRVEC